MRYVITCLVFLLLPSSMLAQIKNNGNCNANIIGSGNNVTIDCSGSNAGKSKLDEVRLVIATNNTPIVQGPINWPYVVLADSDFSIEIDDKQIIYQTMDDVFDDEQLRLTRGEHFYKMDVSLTFMNGFSDTVSCSGIVDAQISASVVPRLHITQNFQTGALSPINCGFDLR